MARAESYSARLIQQFSNFSNPFILLLHNLCFILIVSFTLSSAKPFTYFFIVSLVFIEPKWIWAGEIDNKIGEKLSGVSILKNCHQVNRISIDEN